MLIWKLKSSNIHVASHRYRCFFPVNYLRKIGYHSLIYFEQEHIPFYLEPKIIIFVKSFTSYDISLAQQASNLKIPIVLDICDNIFAEGYAYQSQYKPQINFKEMSKLASVIVTTSESLKTFLKIELNNSVPIFIIPDGNEEVKDYKNYKNWLNKNFLIKKLVSIFDLYPIFKKYKSKILVKSKSAIKKIYSKLKNAFIKVPIAEQEPCQMEIIDERSLEDKKEEVNEIILLEEDKKETSTLNLNIEISDRYSHLQQIIWFGNHGVKPGIGMLALLDIKDELLEVYQKNNYCLHIVSNNYEKYCQFIKPLPFPTRYTPWDLFSSREYISQSDVTIIPNSLDAFNISKSANRAVLSLSLGVPVVATKTPALIPFQDCTFLDDWQKGILSYLSDRELVKQHITRAQAIIKQEYSGEAIARQWSEVIEQVIKSKI